MMAGLRMDWRHVLWWTWCGQFWTIITLWTWTIISHRRRCMRNSWMRTLTPVAQWEVTARIIRQPRFTHATCNSKDSQKSRRRDPLWLLHGVIKKSYISWRPPTPPQTLPRLSGEGKTETGWTSRALRSCRSTTATWTALIVLTRSGPNIPLTGAPRSGGTTYFVFCGMWPSPTPSSWERSRQTTGSWRVAEMKRYWNKLNSGWHWPNSWSETPGPSTNADWRPRWTLLETAISPCECPNEDAADTAHPKESVESRSWHVLHVITVFVWNASSPITGN